VLLRWESDTRYYLIHVSPDLFGDTTIRRRFGRVADTAWSWVLFLNCPSG